MTPDRWRQIEALYQEALEIEPARRGEWVQVHCGGDESLRAEVDSLLYHEASAGDFLTVPAPAKPLEPGQRLGHYEIREKAGEGGMGAVYRAYDEQLRRPVALKVLAPELAAHPEQRQRLLDEARAASALAHPNIIAIHDAGSSGGVDFIAMEFVEGRTLQELIPGRGLPLEQALQYAVQIAAALSTAHAAGLVHRDLKPGNIMVSEQGFVKVLDFGIAKYAAAAEAHTGDVAGGLSDPPGQTAITGTAAYMSPEQAEGRKVDPRSDVFSFGVVLYEMLTGQRPFRGATAAATIESIRRGELAAPLRTLRSDIPADLDGVVTRCLQNDPAARYASGASLHDGLAACQTRLSASALGLRFALQRPRVRAALATVVLLLVSAAGWLGFRVWGARWARTTAHPEIARLVDQEKYIAAFRLGREIDRYAPGDVEMRHVREDIWIPYSIETDPPGADVFIRDYTAAAPHVWEPLGKSPVSGLRLPAGDFCVKIRKDGYTEIEGTIDSLSRTMRRKLYRQGEAPEGMVLVSAAPASGRAEGSPFWIDRYEVTNRQFKDFVDQGGYRRPEFWKQPFEDGSGRAISWADAMARFVDATGQPGPAAWRNGSYPPDQAGHPVAGVSWFEALAYANFAGKAIPTTHHWTAAANFSAFSGTLRASNFRGEGPARAGSFPGVGRFGTYDMAGNVTEWCWNLSAGMRTVRGGSWADPDYMYRSADAAPPFNRDAFRGFRCIRNIREQPPELLAEIPRSLKPLVRNEQPVSDEVFESYRSFYAYDRTPLNARLESDDESSSWWRRERVSFDAAYPGERVIAFVFLPRNAVPPYQTMVFFPPGQALREKTSRELELRRMDFVVRSGRAVVYPIYKNTYERAAGPGVVPPGPNARRDIRIQWFKDFGRVLDYIETRPDLDRNKLVFFGASQGAGYAGIPLALDSRMKTAILQGGGLPTVSESDLPSEVRMLNFLPRVRIPVLMLNGKHDFFNPVEESQKPLFEFLGTPAKDKRHVLSDSGHLVPRADLIREILPWLDRYLGPVTRR